MITGISRKIIQIVLVVALAWGLTAFGFAQQAKEVKKEKIETTSVTKEVQGEISGISKDFIAIVYERDVEKGIEYEMLLPIEKGIRLVHKQTLDQIKVGDIVSVQYEEVTEEYKEVPRQKRTAKIISFVKPAEKKPEPVESETAVLNSEDTGEEGFPIKGIKGQ